MEAQITSIKAPPGLHRLSKAPAPLVKAKGRYRAHPQLGSEGVTHSLKAKTYLDTTSLRLEEARLPRVTRLAALHRSRAGSYTSDPRAFRVPRDDG